MAARREQGAAGMTGDVLWKESMGLTYGCATGAGRRRQDRRRAVKGGRGEAAGLTHGSATGAGRRRHDRRRAVKDGRGETGG